jgi:hypothetical protein
MLLGCVTSMASPFLRLRRARGQERQQLKWFAYTTALTATCFILLPVVPESSAVGSPGWVLDTVVWYLMWIGISVLPIATAIAILRYRLYDIDRIINRTLVYGLLTALLAAVYFGGVTETQATFRTLTGQEKQSQLAIVVSTLMIAALFSPLRRRI